MIRPRLPSPRLALGLLFAAAGAVSLADAAESTPADPNGPPAVPESAPPPAPDPGRVAAPGSPSTPTAGQPKTAPPAKSHATEEIAGLLKLGPSLTDRGDYPAAEIAFYQVLNRPRAPENGGTRPSTPAPL